MQKNKIKLIFKYHQIEQKVIDHIKRLANTKPKDNPFVTNKKTLEMNVISVDDTKKLAREMTLLAEKPIEDRNIGIKVSGAKTLCEGIEAIGKIMPEIFTHNRFSIVYIELK